MLVPMLLIGEFVKVFTLAVLTPKSFFSFCDEALLKLSGYMNSRKSGIGLQKICVIVTQC